ncbi:DEAD/DEAH box helicase [Butyrivibrio fibrisolvens]|uniref:DEAD/DEAH box helicase n=1 Tax=Butyrivibrio fibrisolvens TaxID=831 RepID=UPI0003B74A16|nr:DEAD/DEAH box helicase [Butyrivibrio fibrisolvens]
MKLSVYKGFDKDFLSELEGNPLLDNKIASKLNVLKFDKKMKKKLDMALISLEDEDEVWATYEEFTLIKNRVDVAIEEDDLQVVVYVNNLYPDYYPIRFELTDDLIEEIEKNLNSDSTDDSSDECQRYLSVFNALVEVDGTHYGSFYNYEYEKESNLTVEQYYPNNTVVEDAQVNSDIDIFINEDVDTYLRDLARIEDLSPSVIGVKMTDGQVSKRILSSLQAYCVANDVRLINFHEQLEDNEALEQELIDIATNEMNIANFEGFRTIKFYKNPDIDKDIVEISQATLIEEIIRQAENSYDDSNDNKFRDIFITASTGAGKSVMFQIPAIYLAEHYHKLTIIIEPVKALMQDQKEKLINNGYTRVDAFNSDLISQVEKEAVLQRIKDGEVDLLYLSPETLLSYSIETIIGDREIGLLIVDEAHIVTTWGMGFRPDYWYLGGYINRLRNQIQTATGRKRRTYHFPICAFTATAINGGIDDSVSDTIISLYMENPIKYIGYVRRDDIGFDINVCESKKLPKEAYEEQKTDVMSKRITGWLSGKKKTIVYFPYAQNAFDASRGVRSFVGIKTDPRIGVFTGKNVDELNVETFNEKKRETFDKFRSGEQHIIYATKAFGMGVDIDDVKYVYHYAASGNLCDYVQEIGRAARKPGMDGLAITDFFYNDMTFMNRLFGMSQIRQYQIKKVLEGIYDVYKSKKGARSFLISPQSFTYIFNGKGIQDEGQCINKLKTCLLMLEKDFYDKYNFKVIISRPQSVFTKAYVVIDRNYEEKVLNSEYGECFRFIAKGRYKERQPDGSLLSDTGDVFSLDLKKVWEEFHANISFPQFKFWYFNDSSTAKEKVSIMPSIRKYFSPRQKVNIEARGDLLLNEIREKILEDFEYIADTLYDKFGKTYFTTDDFTNAIRGKYGMTQARIIANSLFELVDPNMTCVKRRNNDTSMKNFYMLSNGNFKEYLRKSVIKAPILNKITKSSEASYSSYMDISGDEWSNIALKLLSIFDYISYEILGGEEPEIFIRLNDPQKIKNIVLGNAFYSNNYVTKAKQKHDRDVSVLLRFFNGLKTDEERWDYIENYFLGYDVLCEPEKEVRTVSKVEMVKSVDKEKSYPTHQYKTWEELSMFFDDNDHVIVDKIAALDVPIPEYLSTTIKKSDWGDSILMSWPSKNTLICQQDTPDHIISGFIKKGWKAYRIYEVDLDELKGDLS